MQLKERLQLIALGIFYRGVRVVEYLSSVWHYYGNALFRKVDLALVYNSLLENPYAISREFALLKGEANVYTYGETPLTTLETIVQRCGIQASDCVYELGCGRGRSCFWLRCVLGCSVVGIEYNPRFARKAQAITAKFGLDRLEFRCEDFLKSDYTEATVVYLYGTCLEDAFLRRLVMKLKGLKEGTKVITVSYPLTDYCNQPLFVLKDAFDVRFTWGTATVYLQEKKFGARQHP